VAIQPISQLDRPGPLRDSAFGVLRRQHWVNESKLITVDLTPRRDLAFQFRYAHDDRVNNGTDSSSGTIYHPDSTANLYANPDGTLKREWAFFTALNPGPFWTGGRGYKFTAVGRRDLGRWGEHTLSGFYNYLESWVNRCTKGLSRRLPKRTWTIHGGGSLERILWLKSASFVTTTIRLARARCQTEESEELSPISVTWTVGRLVGSCRLAGKFSSTRKPFMRRHVRQNGAALDGWNTSKLHERLQVIGSETLSPHPRKSRPRRET